MKTKLMLAAIAASLTLSAAAHAEELAALKGVPAEAMSRSEMAAVEGRLYRFALPQVTSLIGKYLGIMSRAGVKPGASGWSYGQLIAHRLGGRTGPLP